MDIRLLEPRDIETAADLFHDMSAHYNPGHVSPREAVHDHLVKNMLGPHSGVRLVLAMLRGRAVGVATVSILYPAPKERGQLFMKDLYVHSGHRGAGVGEQLMAWVARYAVAHDCVRFDWTAEAGNAGALRFYAALGARRVEEKIYFRFDGERLAALASGAAPPANGKD